MIDVSKLHPRPWRIDSSTNGLNHYIRDASGRLIATIDQLLDDHINDARLAVLAANNFPILIKHAMFTLMEHAAYASEAGGPMCECETCLTLRPITEQSPEEWLI